MSVINANSVPFMDLGAKRLTFDGGKNEIKFMSDTTFQV